MHEDEKKGGRDGKKGGRDQRRLMRVGTASIGEMSRGRLATPNPSPRIVTARGPAASGAAFFFSVSEQADGERRRTPWLIWRYLKTPHLAGTSPMLPSDSIQPSAFAVGMPRSLFLPEIERCTGTAGDGVDDDALRLKKIACCGSLMCYK